MADKVTYTSELKLRCVFDDDDTRILTFDNPVSGLDKNAILDLQGDMINNQPLIGDKTGAAFVKFDRAQVVNKTKIVLDLG